MNKRQKSYETDDGIKLTLRPVSSKALEMVRAKVRLEIRAEGGFPEQPVRYAKSLGGDVVSIPLTEASLAGATPEQTAENEAKWTTYQEAVRKMEAEAETAVMNAILALGVECEVPDPSEWFDDLKWAGVLDELPEDPRDQKVAYLLYSALNDLDRETIIGTIAALGVGQAVSNDQLATFRRNVVNQARRQAESIFDGLADDETSSAMDGVEPVLGIEDSEGVGPDA